MADAGDAGRFSVFTHLEKYNEVWETPSKSEQGSMPIGNGEIGLNVWVEENGDLLFYIARTDSWSGNGRLLKLGRLRVALDPSPFATGMPFRQELRLKDGEITIRAGAEGKQVRLRVWVDANRPVIHVEAEGDQPFQADVSLEVWRTAKRQLEGKERNSARGIDLRTNAIVVEPDTVLPAEGNTIRWYHRNEKSVYADVMKNQHLHKFIEKYPDPLVNRTFGGLIEAKEMVTKDGKTLTTQDPVTRFQAKIHTLTKQTDTVEQWREDLEALRSANSTVSLEDARSAHQAWWNQFWQRSWFFASGEEDAESVTRAYILQRWINACNGRGRYPIKFNGAIFTVGYKTSTLSGKYTPQGNLDAYDGDYRRWGGCYWWQNTRLPYWAMLGSGDYDLMKPLYDMYIEMIPLLKDRTQVYFGHEGIYCGETIYPWGLYASPDFGIGNKDFYARNSYIRYYFQSGIELCAMMLDRFIQTQDEEFVRDYLLPVVENVVTFYDQHYKRGKDGNICITPAASLETYRWGVENPLPVVVGLRVVLTRLLALPTSLSTEAQRTQWKRMLDEIPPVPMKTKDGRRCIAPAEVYEDKRGNSERPEFYTLFPYRLHGVGQPDFDVALNTWNLTPIKPRVGCWHQDLAQAACLGLTADAKKFVIQLAGGRDRASRFPAFWAAGHDWLPDQCHGGNLMIGVHRMLLQWDDQGKMFILPAWPKEWDVQFKLHASRMTTVEGRMVNGNLSILVSPRDRESDIVLPESAKTNN